MSVEDIDNIRKRVLDRAKKESATASSGGSPEDPDGPPKIDSKLIRDCLLANELGDGILYSTLFRDRFLFNSSTQEWLEWTGQFWQRDMTYRSLASVERVVDLYLDECKRIGAEIIDISASAIDGDGSAAELKRLHTQQSNLLKRVSQLRSDKRRTACLKFAYSIDTPLTIKGDELDCKPMLLPCANGVIDLETGLLTPGRPGDYLSLASPVEFTGIDTPAPLWSKSLLEIFGGNEALVSYLQRLIGYSATGLVSEKVFAVLWGKTGWNGRSLIIETISYVMGSLAGSIPSEMLLSQKFSRSGAGPSPDIMSLRGLRMAFASEIDEGQRFSTSKIKWLSGRDELIGRSPHDKYQTRFTPTHKLILQTNIQPSAPPNDQAFWERLHLIPFFISFVNRDPREAHERRAILDLDQQIKKEASGVLAWIIRGCLVWQRDGLNPPSEITDATEQYRRNEDLISDWIDECCLREPGAQEKSAVLYSRFVTWYHENVGQKEPTGTWFGKQLGQKFEKGKSNGCNTYHGIALNISQGGFEGQNT